MAITFTDDSPTPNPLPAGITVTIAGLGSAVTDGTGTVALTAVQGTAYTATFSGTGAPTGSQSFIGGSAQANYSTDSGNEVTDDSGNNIIWTTGTITTVAVAGYAINYVHVTQAATEVLAEGDASGRVTQVSLESLLAGDANVRITQLALEVLVQSIPPNIRVTQAVLKALVTSVSNVRVTQAVLKALINATPPQYTVQSFVVRVLNLLPKPWWSRAGLAPGGIAYIYVYAIAAALSGHKVNQLDYTKNQMRIQTATGYNLDNIALDFFGTTLLRNGRSDTQFRQVILAALIAPKVTLAAMQAGVNTYFASTFTTSYSQRPTCRVYDQQSDPADSATYNIEPPEFVIEVVYPLPAGEGWILGQSNLGRTTTLFNTAQYQEYDPTYFDPGLMAVVNSIRAEGTKPVYLGRNAYY